MNTVIQATITLLLLFLSPLTAFVLDTDGEPIQNNGRSYYIIPKGGRVGGLTLIDIPGMSDPCQLFITREPNSLGLSLKISSPLRIANIPLSTNVKLVFDNDNATGCNEPLEWRVTSDDTNPTSDRLYVTAGETLVTMDQYSFTIEEANIGKSKYLYKIRNCPQFVDEPVCREVGFFKDNGLVGITNEKPLYVQFKKAN